MVRRSVQKRSRGSTYAAKARKVIDVEIDGLRKVRDGLGKEFDAAVKLILERLTRGGKIVVTGVGKNQPIGQKIAATLTSTGCPAVFLHPSDAMHGDLGILQSHDVLLALSYSGESEELVNLVPVVKRSGVAIVALSGDKDSAVARHSDVVVSVAVAREACPFNMAPTASTTATLAVGDALAMSLLQARGFRKEDYAKLHPGGAIGRALLLRIADIMRTGDRLAKVRSGSQVKDALVAMTSARAGSAAVVDSQDHVLGIFTDGDLRRHISSATNIAEQTIDDVMTRHPIALTTDQLAVDLLALYEKYNIDDIVIVDGQDRLAGMVDIQDLPKFKIL
ncbi:MAG: KpsF/GutQ family sugar-phosphate isomerase [Verrucomicrobiota bacterium]